jgi:hypothetical protein
MSEGLEQGLRLIDDLSERDFLTREQPSSHRSGPLHRCHPEERAQRSEGPYAPSTLDAADKAHPKSQSSDPHFSAVRRNPPIAALFSFS